MSPFYQQAGFEVEWDGFDGVVHSGLVVRRNWLEADIFVTSKDKPIATYGSFVSMPLAPLRVVREWTAEELLTHNHSRVREVGKVKQKLEVRGYWHPHKKRKKKPCTLPKSSFLYVDSLAQVKLP